MKKSLAQQLRIRTETIEYRQIRSRLMNAAQNRQNTYRVLRLQENTILQLQNDGIKVERIKEFDNEKWLLSW